MPKFGGYGKLKKKCKFRTCSNQIQSRNLRKINKLVPVPFEASKLNIVVPEFLNNNNLSQNKPQCSLLVSPQSISTLSSSSSLPCSDMSNTKNSKVTPEIISPLADHNYTVEAISVNEGYREAKETLMDNEPYGADELETETVDNDMAVHREGSRTDTDTKVDREAEAIKLDGLSVSEVKQLRDSAEKHAFQAEVNRMMKLIINSLYKNKDVFLRELISNASDALDKLCLLCVTDKSILDATEELTIKIKADKENRVLHITDTGIGMTKADLINNLGTIAKSGTSEFFDKLQDAASQLCQRVVDSDELPLNVSGETLQQHELLKVIKKKLVRKTLDMIMQIPTDKYMEFWKEYSTNVKLGVIEDTANRTRLAKLLRLTSSSGNLTSLAEYVERMKDKQEAIYYIAGGSKEEVSSSPFFENLLKKGYELLLLTEAMDEYAISSLPEFEGKKFQNVAKEGFNLDGDTEASRERREAVKEKFDSLTKWLGEDALNDNILRAEVSERLVDSPCALVTSK